MPIQPSSSNAPADFDLLGRFARCAPLPALLALGLLGCDPGGSDDDGESPEPTDAGDTDAPGDDDDDDDGTDDGTGGDTGGTDQDSGSDDGVDDDSGTDDPTPSMGVIDVDFGNRYTVAVMADGRVFSWGQIPNAGGNETPLEIAAISGAVAVDLPFILLDDGTAVEFDGTAAPTPLELEGIHDISGGDGGANCAIAGDDRQLYCWGFSGLGVLGFDPPENPEVPTVVPGMTGVADVAVGSEHTCVLMEGGEVQCTGRGESGQLGDGAFDSSRVGFEPVIGDADFVQLSTSGDSACGLRASGELVCWGWTWITGSVGTPTAPVSGIPNGTGLISSDHMQCIWDEASLWCWGYGPSGGVGNGQTWSGMAQEDPFQVEGLPPIAGGRTGTCVYTTEGELYCWGENSFGETGTGLPDSSVLEPTLVEFPE